MIDMITSSAKNSYSMEELIDYIEQSISLTAEMRSDLHAISIVKNVQKGEVLLSEKSLRKIQIFVVSGCLRSYYKTDNGKEHTLQFAIKNWWIGDYITMFKNEHSIMNIESISHSKVILFEHKDLENLYIKYPTLAVLQRKGLENRVAALQKRVLGLLTLTAKEKYQRFVADYQLFEKVIPNYQIASFLGITPESLSRVRKEISIT